MDIRFQVALENALLYAHQLMRQVGSVLFASVSSRSPAQPPQWSPHCGAVGRGSGWLSHKEGEGEWEDTDKVKMTRATRTELIQKLRLAEHFLRRAIALLAADMVSELPPPCPVSAAGTTRPKQRKPVPRALALVEPSPRFSSAGRMPAGTFDSLSPDDPVSANVLVKRLARLQATLANPIARARRLAFWRRRQRGRSVLRPRLIAPRPMGEVARHLWNWLTTIDADAREALRLEPG